jgi:uncharacterized protein (DUF2267 family)
MSMTGLEAFDRTVQETNVWLRELTEDLHLYERQRAYLALRAVLHATRDRLPMYEVVQLGAQLPLLVRGIYYEGWDAKERALKDRKLEHYYQDVQAKYVAPGTEDAERLTKGVFALLSRHVSAGQVQDVKQALFAELRGLWEAAERERGLVASAGERGVHSKATEEAKAEKAVDDRSRQDRRDAA